MQRLEDHLRLLGFKAKDVVTGFEGVIETIAFDLYGCVQAIVRPRLDKDGKIQDGKWFDLARLSAVSKQPVMKAPTFVSVPGGSEKPAQPSSPSRWRRNAHEPALPV